MRSKAIRIVTVIGGAAISGALIGSVCLFAYLLTLQGAYRASPTGFPLLIVISLPFTLIGSLLLSVIYKWLLKRFSSSRQNIIVGFCGLSTGFLLLQAFFQFLRSQGAPPYYQINVALIGAGFGAATAFSWVILHKITRAPAEPASDF